MDINVLCVLEYVLGWCLEQGLPLRAMAEAEDEDMAEPLAFMSLYMMDLHRKKIGKFMLVNNRKGIEEKTKLS